jgi:predicted nucleic acid-binding protein
MDPTKFHKYNVIDTCSIWNLLASKSFYGTARAVGCRFSCTQFVVYECLRRPHSTTLSVQEEELRESFRKENQSGAIKDYKISIQDLQTVEILENRKRLGKGELSAIVFAIRTRQAFLSDDKGAIKLALTELSQNLVQSTTLLFAWLFFHGHLADPQKEQIILELEKHGRNMRKHYEGAYNRALEFKLVAQSNSGIQENS